MRTAAARRALRPTRRLVRRLGTELARGRHALRPHSAAAEIIGRALGPGGDPAALIAAFRDPPPGPLPLGADDAEAIVAELERLVPGWRARTLTDAERICRHVVRLLGSDAIELRTAGAPTAGGYRPIPWHEDVQTGYAWDPRAFYRQIEIPAGRADIKVPWELSRAQHLPTLGMAHVASGEDRFAAEIVAQIDDWIAANPPGLGVNWACTMDVAIRAVNWLWAFRLVSRSAPVTEAFTVRVLASLIEHARHIAGNLERYAGGLTTNHTTADYAGLFHLGHALAALPEAGAWRLTAQAGLEECMGRQVHPDGGAFENSIAYHRLVLELLAAAHVLAEHAGTPFSAAYRSSLHRMFDFTRHCTRPDGLVPLIGDADDGRLAILSSYFDWNPQDHRYLLAVGGALFADDDLAAAAAGQIETAAWLLGPAAARRLPHAPAAASPPRSRAFPATGRYVMRHGAHQAVIGADEVGTAGLGNHKHNDILAVELSVAGVAMIVDGGSFLYTSDPVWRDRFRSTRAHNTVAVDGAEQNEMTGPFGMRADARVRVTAWRSHPAFDLLEAEHTGYERLPDPVIHRRRIVLAGAPFACLVLDDVRAAGVHDLEAALHLAPGGEVRAVDLDGGELDRRLRAMVDTAGLSLPAVAAPASGFAYRRAGVGILVAPLGWAAAGIEPDWFSPRYGQRVPASVLRLRTRAGAGVTLGVLILAR